MKKSIMAMTLVGCICWLSACGARAPSQGAGALYIFDHGVSKCVEIQSICFLADGWLKYTNKNGESFNLNNVAHSYYAGEACR